jgi:hypothetical protein
MRVPTVHCRDANVTEKEKANHSVGYVVWASVLVGALVWTLAIAKVIDLFRFH